MLGGGRGRCGVGERKVWDGRRVWCGVRGEEGVGWGEEGVGWGERKVWGRGRKVLGGWGERG